MLYYSLAHTVYLSQVVLTVSQIMWCCDLTECLTTTEGSVVEEVKQAEQRCFQVSTCTVDA